MKAVKVYKTDVKDGHAARKILNEIREYYISSDSSFDLEDRDNVLRIENSAGIDENKVRNILQKHGFKMEELN